MADKDKAAEGRQAQGDKGGRRKAHRKAKSGGKKAAAPGKRAPQAPRPADYKPRLKTHYEKVVRDALHEEVRLLRT